MSFARENSDTATQRQRNNSANFLK